VLLAQLEGLAEQGPALLVFEDPHWIDPTLLELLGLLVKRAANLPLLALLTARPEFVPRTSWTGRRHVTLLSLEHLDRRQAAVLADCVNGKPLPSEVVEQIVTRADGVPLFIEELTRAVLEAGPVGSAGGRHVLGGSLPPFTIPAALHDSLMTRLDRLAWAKEVAQVAACIGRDFSHEMLVTMSAVDAERLAAALDQLAGCDLIVRRGTPPDVTYAFRHALIQEAAYGSMLKSDRQALPAHIARAAEEHYAQFADARPEWLARHCTEAGLVGPATDYWLKAALRTKNAYAN
jgi:predicted ATPase